MDVLHVVGARPNFVKAAPVRNALNSRGGVRQTLVHTGQHYDRKMSAIFFEQLGIPDPDINLEVGSGTHSQQTALIMSRLEPVIVAHQPDIVLVYGDVNSTLAAAIVCAKLFVRVAHIEAGLRSFDRTMPEEINRILTDRIADLLFTPSPDGDDNLKREGIEPHKIFLVGNVMVDTLLRLLETVDSATVLERLKLGEQPYALVTLHRPSNVDDLRTLSEILATLEEIARDITVVFPVHPRTRRRITDSGLIPALPRLQLIDPLGYLDFLALQKNSKMVLTDSGGIQEETTVLGVPCLTLRENTERPITVEIGTNILVGGSTERLLMEVRKILDGKGKVRGCIPPLWDGKASDRIADILLSSDTRR